MQICELVIVARVNMGYCGCCTCRKFERNCNTNMQICEYVIVARVNMECCGCRTCRKASRLEAVSIDHIAYKKCGLDDKAALLVHLVPQMCQGEGGAGVGEMFACGVCWLGFTKG